MALLIQDIPALKDLKKEDLVYFGYRVEPYFASHIILSGMLNKKALKKIFDWDTGVRWLQIDFSFFQFKEDLDLMEGELKRSLKEKGLIYVNSVVKQCIEYGDALLKASKELGKSASHTESKKELAQALEEYFVAMTTYTAFYSMAMFERPMMEMAESFAKRKAATREHESELFDLITTSARETAVEFEQEDFLALAARKQANKDELAHKHAEKYGWLSIRFFVGKPWTTEDVLTRLKDMTNEAAAHELQTRLLRRKEREGRIEKAIATFSKEDKEIVRQIREIVYLRNQRADYYNESAYHIRPLLEKVASVLSITYADLVYVSTSELVSALLGTSKDFMKLLEKRKQAFLVYHNGDNSFVTEGEVVHTYLKQKLFLVPENETAKEVTGRIGYKGKVTGRAIIVKLEEDISKVQSGDILVTPMTIPNFMPAMEKAIAFVTDEGGITCHAAIVAREMHKPCIIGTKIATQIFKDGDMIEVDAMKGVARKLGK